MQYKKDETIRDLTVDNTPCRVGQAVAYFERHGVAPERMRLQMSAEPLGTRSEIGAQKPEPGTPWSRDLDVVLTINPGAVLKNPLRRVLQRLARNLLFSATQDDARRTLGELIFYLHEALDKDSPSRWQAVLQQWRQNKEAAGEAIPLEALLKNESLMQLRLRLPEIVKTNLPGLILLLTDKGFAGILEEYFEQSNFTDDRSTHASHYSRFAFLTTPETLAAEKKLSAAQQQETLHPFKRYLIFLYARLERFENVQPADLVQVYLRRLLAAGKLGVQWEELERWFERAQVTQLYEDLTGRRHRLFTTESYVEKLAQYLGIEAAVLQHEQQKDGAVRIFATTTIHDKQKQRAAILHHLLVPITAPIKYEWEAPYMKLGRRYSNELGRMRLR